MSFLSNANSEFLSARLTKKGRNSIAKGNFNIVYFQVGDSEFDYNTSFSGLTGVGNVSGQKIFSPFDIESGVKYPYKLDNTTTGTTTYGTPIEESSIETIRNVMGPAGMVSDYSNYTSGTTVEHPSATISLTNISGSTSINVTSGNTFQECQYITLVLGTFTGSSATITGNSNSLIYKITGITGNTLYLDRQLPNLSSLSGNATVVCNKHENEYNSCTPIDFTSQLNPWTLNVVWSERPIGGENDDEVISGYTSNYHVSTKEFLGYTSTGQTFTDYTGTTITSPTSFQNCYDETIDVSPDEQRCIAILHYSELGDITIDSERFFKYDDYISYDESTINTVATDYDGNEISDNDYFEVYLPFIYYHRNTGTTFGALFKMGEDSYYIKSSINDKHQLLFRYLLDEQNVKVGKVFPHNKTIVFDDQELVALLDYRSNRRHTLDAPKAFAVPSDDIPVNSLLSGSTGQTIWITYMLQYSDTSSAFNSLPCNYFLKVTGTTLPSSVAIKFDSDALINLKNGSLNDIKTGFVAKRFYILAQKTNSDENPVPSDWKYIEYTTEAGGNGTTLLDRDNITGITFTLTETLYDAAPVFDLEDFMLTNYLGDLSFTTQPQFGDEQPFPGSIKLVRASDLESMVFAINLPSSQFNESQNPTYTTGVTKKITEVALLDSNKDALVVAKAAVPITRSGTQVLSVQIDF